MNSWIKFVFMNATPKTKIWEVLTSDDSSILGHVKWFGRWRKYSFYPENDTIFEQACLRDIANFCEEQTRLKRMEWRKA